MKFFSAVLFFSVLVYEVYTFQGHFEIRKLPPKHLGGLEDYKTYAAQNFNKHQFLDTTKWNKKLRSFEPKKPGENYAANTNYEPRANEMMSHFSNAFRDWSEAANNEIGEDEQNFLSPQRDLDTRKTKMSTIKSTLNPSNQNILNEENLKYTNPNDLFLKKMKYEPQSELSFLFGQLPNRRRKRTIDTGEGSGSPPEGSENPPEGSENPSEGSESTTEGSVTTTSESPSGGSGPKSPPKKSEPESPPKKPEPESPPKNPEPESPPKKPEPESPPKKPEPESPPKKPEPESPPKKSEPESPPEKSEPGSPPGGSGEKCPSEGLNFIELLEKIAELKEKLAEAYKGNGKEKGIEKGEEKDYEVSYYDYYSYYYYYF